MSGKLLVRLAVPALAALAAGALLTARHAASRTGPAATAARDEGAAERPLPSPPAPPPTASASGAPAPDPDDAVPATLDEQRRALYRRMAAGLSLSEASLAEVRAVVEASPYLGQGNPTVTRHPMTRSRCRALRAEAGLPAGPAAQPPCELVNMAPVFDPEAGQTAGDARVCIDRFEFPDLACEYPVVYARAREAALLCRAVGKRICDAHEWEGACAGALHAPEVEYAWDKPRPYATYLHNKARAIRWAYGPGKNHALCATGSRKSPACEAGGWTLCGSNTYPAGAFPACVSPFGAYDLHGNAAEHMNLPLAPDELAGRGGTGATEMKGSWFIFAGEQPHEPHEDDCRWRAKDWHPSKLMDEESHRNYHLGFRCCKDVAGSPPVRDGG
jgi:formylglycine-generating enzyme required for sulfatase activity